jgi:hypothetical protein
LYEKIKKNQAFIFNGVLYEICAYTVTLSYTMQNETVPEKILLDQ